MAKSKSAKKPTQKAGTKKLEQATKEPLHDPAALHTLLGIPGPYDPPPPPVVTKGYVVWWDPGCSIQTLARKKPELFHLPKVLEGQRYAKDTDSWKWRLWRVEPIEPDLTFEEQKKKLKTGEEPAAARELASYLLFYNLVTGERLDLGRLRCKDVLESGQRMTVWFSPMGFDFASVSDDWTSPGIGLSAMCTPVVRRK